MVRLLLAATLGAKYGTYGPVFELGENTRGAPEPRIAGEHVAFHRARQSLPARKPAAARSNLFQETDNSNPIFCSKTSPDRSNAIIIGVDID